VHVQEIYVGAHLVDDFAGIYFKYTLSAEGVRRKKMLLSAISQWHVYWYFKHAHRHDNFPWDSVGDVMRIYHRYNNQYFLCSW